MNSSDAPDPGLYQAAFINLHTIKGAARTLGFTLIADAAHGAEDKLAQIQRENAGGELSQLEFDIQLLTDVIHHYERVSVDKLKWLDTDETIQLKERDVEGLMSHVKTLEASCPPVIRNSSFLGIRRFVVGLVYEDLKQTILELTKTLPGLARDLHKPEPRVTCDTPSVGISKAMAAAMGDALVHILRNIMDHGVESLEARMRKGKDPHAVISFSSRKEQDGRLLVMVSDDGQGLHLEKIREIANRKGLIKDEDQRSIHDIANLIFLPGFSTSSSVNQVSGRGVGMGAVKELIEKFGGAVHLVTEGNETGPIPFKLLMNIPQQHVIDLDPA